MGYEDWHAKIFEQDLEERAGGNIEAYRIGRASSAQEQAVREFAASEGFKDLRGFHTWMRSVDKDYYDILKIMSP